MKNRFAGSQASQRHVSRAAFTGKRRAVVALLLLVSLLPVCTTGAAEQTIWRLGKVDRSEHEFGGSTDRGTNKPMLVRIGSGNEVGQWPKFQPGSGNGAYHGHPYTQTIAFELPAAPSTGVCYLDLSLLFRQPRVPALEVTVNGHRGRYYFDPEPMVEIGNGNDQFNPIRSVQRRRIPLPAGIFRAGENLIDFNATDDPARTVDTRTVGGTGDSGFYYDALELSYDSAATFDGSLSAALTPTVLYQKTREGTREECWLTVGDPEAWSGGRARVTIGSFTREIAITLRIENQ